MAIFNSYVKLPEGTSMGHGFSESKLLKDRGLYHVVNGLFHWVIVIWI